MHIRRFDVANEVPIGDISQARGNSGALPYASPHGQTIQVPENEQQVFDTWLRDRWIEKDQFIQHFHDTGSFSSSLKEHPEIGLPLRLRHKREILDSFCFFIPPIIAFIWAQILRLIQ
jgi:Acyltransferase C-terminus